jgi:hypothetical protein
LLSSRYHPLRITQRDHKNVRDQLSFSKRQNTPFQTKFPQRVDRIAYAFFASTTTNFHFLKSNLHFLRQSFWRTTPANNFLLKLVFPIPITFLTRTSGVRLPARFFPLLRVFSLGSAPCSRFTSLRLLVFFMSVCVRAHMMWTRCVFCMCVCAQIFRYKRVKVEHISTISPSTGLSEGAASDVKTTFTCTIN